MDYQCTQSEEIERQREYERLEIAREKSMQEFTDTFKEFLERLTIQRKEEEKRIFEEAARQEEEKRIAKEKEAAELEAKLSTKRIPLSDFIPPVTPNVETVNSLKIRDKHLDTQKGSLESSVKDPIPIPSESNDTSNGARDSLLNDDKFQRALNDWCNLAQQNSMLSIYDENNKIRDCYKLSPSAITPDLLITDSLIMEDEHLDTIPVTESANTIKSSVDDLVPTPSESADFSDNESECDMPVCDDFMTFSNPLFDSNDDFTSSDDESLSDEDVPKENFKIYSNPLFDEEIISTKIDPHCFNAESYLIKSLLNRDTLIDSSPKFDYLLEEFSGELAHIDPIPPGIEKADFDLEEEIRLVENLFDSLTEEIDLFLASNDSMPPGIEDDDYDSEGDIRFFEELLNNDSLPLPENESSNLDHFNDPSPSRPPPEPPDVEICFDFMPDAGVVTNKVVGDISEHNILMPNLLPTQPTLCPVFDLLLLFSSENEDKVFNPGILISPLLSHRGEIISNFSKSPMMISGGDIPHLDVPFLHFYPP
ncbi:hypothetical protein Tco_1553534 [Tanacetum coccineum]